MRYVLHGNLGHRKGSSCYSENGSYFMVFHPALILVVSL